MAAAAEPPYELQESSSGSQTTQYTPEEDSEASDLDQDELHKSYELQKRARDSEKGPASSSVPQYEDGEYHDNRRRRESLSTVQSFQLYTPDEERAVVKKFDRRLVLFVALLYMLSFLDRSNIGNAQIAGLAQDLNISSNQYEWILTAFYFTYICFEWMSLLWKIIPAHIYVTMIVLSWGIVASLQACTTSFASLIVLRILLGIGEAGFTGIPFYLSFFFKREELALRTGFFISAAPLATSFASSLAWIIVKLGQNGPIAPWRLLFLVEGFPSVLVAVIAWHVIPDGPGRAKYLNRREKKVARLRLRSQGTTSSADNGNKGLKWREMLRTVADPKSYITALMFFCTNMAFGSLPVFLPTVIRKMGHSVLVSQALSAPPYLIAFFAVILTAYLSDRLRNRSYFVCFHALISALGYAFIALAGHQGWDSWWRYAGVFPAAIGFFSVITLIITWTINNQESESQRGMGFAMLQIIGQCGPFVGTRLYPDSDAPLYVKGMSVCAVAMLFVAVLSFSLRMYLQRLNRKNELKYSRIGDETQEDEAQETLVSKKASEKQAVRFEFMF